jgi:hypothetical protein
MMIVGGMHTKVTRNTTGTTKMLAIAGNMVIGETAGGTAGLSCAQQMQLCSSYID